MELAEENIYPSERLHANLDDSVRLRILAGQSQDFYIEKPR
jgi:hypothetical protein